MGHVDHLRRLVSIYPGLLAAQDSTSARRDMAALRTFDRRGRARSDANRSGARRDAVDSRDRGVVAVLHRNDGAVDTEPADADRLDLAARDGGNRVAGDRRL